MSLSNYTIDKDTLNEMLEDEDLTPDERMALEKFARDLADYCSDWEYGDCAISDSYFRNYAQELAEDLGLLSTEQWPAYCIDWDWAARELQHDYTAVEDPTGGTWWVR